MKFYGESSRWADLADKYKVREYVESLGLGHILVDLYGKWDNIEDVDWNELPDEFVLKANNGCGDMMICRDKETLDIKKTKEYFRSILTKPYGVISGEPHYAKIKPCIIAEELLDNSAQEIKSSSLVDYKIWVFNGKPAYTFACYNRTKENTNVGVYDYDWNFHPEYSNFNHHYSDGGLVIPRPNRLAEMYEIASKLAADFPIVRVDLYEVNGKVYFGELTFTSLGGFMDYFTQDFLKKCGDMVTLPDKNKNNVKWKKTQT